MSATIPQAPDDGALSAALERAEAAIGDLVELVAAGGFSQSGRLRALEEMQASVNRLQGGIVEDVRQIDEAGDWRGSGSRSAADFVRHRLRLEACAWKYATLARNGRHIPRLCELFASGAANIEQVYDSWTRLKELPVTVPEDAGYNEEQLANAWAAADECLAGKAAEGLRGSQLKVCAEHILAGLDAEGHQNGKDKAKSGHGISVSKLRDETIITGTASAAEGEELDRALRKTEAWAKDSANLRSPRRRRLDALMELAEHYLDCGKTPRRKSARYHLVVHTEFTGLIRALLHAITHGGSLAQATGERATPLDVLATLLTTGPGQSSSGSLALSGDPASAARALIDSHPLVPALLRACRLSPAARLESGALLGYRELIAMLTDPNGVDLTRVITGLPGCVPRTWPGPAHAGPGIPGPAHAGPGVPGPVHVQHGRPGPSTGATPPLQSVNGMDRGPGASRHESGASPRPGAAPQSRHDATREGPPIPGDAAAGSDPTERMGAAMRAMLAQLPPPLGAPSELLDVGRTERFHTPAMRIGLAVRDGAECVVPGCGMPAEYLEIHHVSQWRNHGRTNTGDAAPCCGVHNRSVEIGAVIYRDLKGRWIYRAPPPEAYAA